MTVTIISGAPNREIKNANELKDRLISSEPRLTQPGVRLNIIVNLLLPERQVDLALIYKDDNPKNPIFRNTSGDPIHSFVAVIEAKRHSPDLIKFRGTDLLVRYDGRWSNASDQCDEQTYALKRFQQSTYIGSKRRRPTYVQRAIWLPNVPRDAVKKPTANSSVPVHFAEITWSDLVSRFWVNPSNPPQVRTLADEPSDIYHTLESLTEHLTCEVKPTQLDLRRVNALTQARFDAEKTAYIQNLGSGLLMLRGRGGTGKTFALIQIALHLAEQNKKSAILTYNHGLIADVNRALHFIGLQKPEKWPRPDLMTRYLFLKQRFSSVFGLRAESVMIGHVGKLEDREDARLAALRDPDAFKTSPIPDGQCSSTRQRHCPLCSGNGGNQSKVLWGEVCEDGERPPPHWEYILVDEGQDWKMEQRDFIFKTIGPSNVIVADGVDQFVGKDRCQWDSGVTEINRRHALRSSRRTKAATCQTVGELARELGITDWDLEPDPTVYGGRLTVFVDRQPREAVRRGLELMREDLALQPNLRPVDNLACLPSSTMASGFSYTSLFDREIEATGGDSWRGFDNDDRRTYSQRQEQLRAVQYHSCRGMEGWTTLCLGLDRFFDYQKKHPEIDRDEFEAETRAREGFLFSENAFEASLNDRARAFAVNWLLIPLTRSIDHLIIHLEDGNSELGQLLRRVSARHPHAIEWRMDN